MNSANKPKRSQALAIVQCCNEILYGLIFFLGFLAPLGSCLFESDVNRFVYAPLILITTLFMGMAIIGVLLMRRSLSSITNKQAVELWTMIALGIAPFSGCFYLGFIGTVLFRDLSRFIAIGVLVYAFGFFLPFLLLTLWMRYRYRSDEF